MDELGKDPKGYNRALFHQHHGQLCAKGKGFGKVGQKT
jgi:hypothetical protein